MWVFQGKFTVEQGALIRKALEGAMDELFEEQRNEPSDISAETSRRMACDASVVHWHDDVGVGHAGDIVSMAHSYISSGHPA